MSRKVLDWKTRERSPLGSRGKLALSLDLTLGMEIVIFYLLINQILIKVFL